ncbi:Aldehyde/histidinol dehydrogenase [Russula earlei]|uniref:Aldehyde/histidinol dehydrogenase n=1 Tax=Russula earlei TaxID=71964 RepID=A0ACC0TS69_9AGAM|nr:Aldehyde/histidinol dehydrogenase [Russula earlei]
MAGIYDEFLKRFTAKARSIKLGDPFGKGIDQAPTFSTYQRIMSYTDYGKKEGVTVHLAGERFGNEGYFINPTIFTDTKPDMKIVREEIFGPVGVVIKFEDEAVYGLVAGAFSQDINRALETAHKLQAGTAWVRKTSAIMNGVNQLHANVPFGGYTQSGIGRELGEDVCDNLSLYYAHTKAVHINLGHKM